MSYRCDGCGSAFDSELDRDIHRDRCEDGTLQCDRCGERFPEASATDDGWRYRCPGDGCDGEGIGTDLYRVRTMRVVTQ